MPSRLKPFGILVIVLSISGLFASSYTSKKAQYSDESQLAAGTILVANEKLNDPNFAQAVVLIVQFDRDSGAEGVVINRQTEIPISRIFPKSSHPLKDPVFLGGPVEMTNVQALVRLPESTDKAVHVMGDIYLTGSRDLIEKSIDSEADPSKFREGDTIRPFVPT